MVVADADFGRAGIRPSEDDPPLVVDSDGMKSLEIALERFEPIPGRNRKVVQSRRMIHLKEFSECNAADSGEATIALLVEQLVRIFVGEGLDHSWFLMTRQVPKSRSVFSWTFSRAFGSPEEFIEDVIALKRCQSFFQTSNHPLFQLHRSKHSGVFTPAQYPRLDLMQGRKLKRELNPAIGDFLDFLTGMPHAFADELAGEGVEL